LRISQLDLNPRLVGKMPCRLANLNIAPFNLRGSSNSDPPLDCNLVRINGPVNRLQRPSHARCTGNTATPPVAAASQTLTIFAAASLTEAFSELGNQFEAKNPGVKVVLNFAGSQQLVQQLAQGAPADVFASANQAQMESAIQAGRIIAGQTSSLVENQLVVIFAQPNTANLRQLQDLAKPGLKLVLADKNVPAGKYALEFLDKASSDPDFGAGFKDAVLKNIVLMKKMCAPS